MAFHQRVNQKYRPLSWYDNKNSGGTPEHGEIISQAQESVNSI
jgi:hypothetical protein